MPPTKKVVEATEPETGTIPIEEPAVEYVNTSKGSVPVQAEEPTPVVVPADESERLSIANEGRDPLGYVPRSDAVVLDENNNPVEITLVVDYIGGGSKEVELKPGSVVEYLGSFVRWVEKDGTLRQAQVDNDIAGVRIKGA